MNLVINSLARAPIDESAYTHCSKPLGLSDAAQGLGCSCKFVAAAIVVGRQSTSAKAVEVNESPEDQTTVLC